MRHLVHLIIFLSFALGCFSSTLPAEDKPDVYGGFTKCLQYKYQCKSGIVDSSSRVLEQSSVYDDKGFEIEGIKYDKDGTILNVWGKRFCNNDDYNSIEKYSKAPDPNLSDTTIFTYDEFGKIKISKNIMLFNDSSDYSTNSNQQLKKVKSIEVMHFENGIYSTKWTFKYNKNGLILEYVWYNNDNSILEKNTKIYDDSGYLLEEENNDYSTSSDYSNCTTKYCCKGKHIVEILYPFLGRKEIYNYYDDNKLVEISSYMGDSLLPLKSIIKYDSRGNKIEESGLNIVWNIFKKRTYKYDEKDRKIEVVMEDSTKYFKSRMAYQYKYDDFGNRIEELYLGKDGKPASLTVYIFTK